MTTLIFPLALVRTDGWLEHLASEIESFDAIVELIGERVFAFSMILGVRITSLMPDERDPEATIVEFVVDEASVQAVRPQQLSLYEFRHRLVSALLSSEAPSPLPRDENDLERLKQYIGIRYLLLAPLYGHSLDELRLRGDEAELRSTHKGQAEVLALDAFRARIRQHLQDELEGPAPNQQDSIDLGHVELAEQAASSGDWQRVFALLHSWPGPLSIFLRTEAGQSLGHDTRALVAKGLGLLGTACVRLGELPRGEDIFRLAVQFASQGEAAGDIFHRIGEAMLEDGRPGEAIAPFRRALRLGAPPEATWPLLARAFLKRDKYVAALACVEEARLRGVPDGAIASSEEAIRAALGPSLEAYRAHMRSQSS